MYIFIYLYVVHYISINECTHIRLSVPDDLVSRTIPCVTIYCHIRAVGQNRGDGSARDGDVGSGTDKGLLNKDACGIRYGGGNQYGSGTNMI